VLRAAHYLTEDASSRRLLLGPEALLKSYLSVGLGAKSRLPHGDTTTWFAEWARRSRTSLAEPARSDRILELGREGWSVAIEPGTGDLLEIARDYAANTTVARQRASARHVFAALLNLPGIGALLVDTLGPYPNPDISDLRQFFLGKVKIRPASDEAPRVEEWDSIILGPLRRLTSIDADRIAETDRGDPLGIGPYVDAFASLICRRSDVSPLSIGLFGEWGSGKSTFMARLRRAIATYTSGAPDTPHTHFFSNIVQIQFNAWHYADANLWASLTTEFFAQLRAGGFGKVGSAVHADLVERVTAHVSKLSLEAATASDVEKEGQIELELAQRQRNSAAAEVAASASPTPQILLDAINQTYEAHKGELSELGLKGDVTDPAATIERFVKLAKSLRTSKGQWEKLGETIRARGWRKALLVLALLSLLGSGALLYFFAPGVPVALLGAIAAAATALAPGIKAINAVLRATSTFSDELDRFAQGKQKELLDAEARLWAASKELTARKEAANRADAALARYRDRTATKNPLRLLRYVLEDAPETKDVAKEVGLISRSRRLFQEVDEIARVERQKASARNKAIAEGREPEAADTADIQVPDRIVLYIDDLDRCTREQVYSVLQAVHLLLAFDIFVVVVGVDLRWVEGAIADHFRSTAGDEDDPQARKKLAVDYLEKIFQIPFWLPNLAVSKNPAASGFGKYVDGLIAAEVRRDKQQQPTETDQARRSDGGAAPVQEAARSGATKGSPSGHADQSTPPPTRLEAMQLEEKEAEFLKGYALGEAANKTPRAVKRLVNIYRLVRAGLVGTQRKAFLERAENGPLYPVAAAVAAIEVGQTVETVNAFYRLLQSVGPGQEATSFAKLADASTPKLPQDVLELLKAVDARRGVNRPAKPEQYRQAAALVGRFSFTRYDGAAE
jgi:hypothetical protein